MVPGEHSDEFTLAQRFAGPKRTPSQRGDHGSPTKEKAGLLPRQTHRLPITEVVRENPDSGGGQGDARGG